MPLPTDIRNNFIALITNRSGLYFKDHDLKNLEDSIALRMKELKLESPMSYYSYLALSEKHEDEFRELMNILTVNHTYFFRDLGQFEALRDKVLLEIIKKKGGRGAGGQGAVKNQIAIWSAGCSSGEEPYTIAIILKELLGEEIKDWDIHILATDASSSALEQAKKGVYRKNAVRNVPPELLEKYFHEVAAPKGKDREISYRIGKPIKHMVNFDYFNLMDEKYPYFFDVIFCRNVVIYFEIETTAAVMEKFYGSLVNDGYLYIGYSETLQYMSDKFKMRISGDGIYYTKIFPPGKLSPLFRDNTEQESGRAGEQEEEQESKRVGEPEAEEDGIGIQETEAVQQIMAEADRAIFAKQYDRALDIVKQAHEARPEAADPYYIEAEAMVDIGDFEGAKKVLQKIELIDPLSARPHYFYGIIKMEENDLNGAKSSLKKALYLDKGFALANFYLGQAYKKEGKLDDSIREYRNASKLLSKYKPDDIIPLSGGFNSVVLLSVCKDNIERLKMEIV